jgi:succinylarginine dihydrolase
MPTAYEVNFDGIVGPTHNYAGLSFGNVASQKNARSISRPREAALQGLAKMKFLNELGVRQAVLPPHPRPDIALLGRFGFTGSDSGVLAKAARENPRLLAAAYSASAMWTANAATVSPGADTADGRVHFTPANLLTQLHRSIEPPVTAAVLRQIFPEGEHFAHHDPLPISEEFADEGAANHMRLAASHGERGIEVFVYGRPGLGTTDLLPQKFPARQTMTASAAIAGRHKLSDRQFMLVRQNPSAIDAGAFHNDVVAVSNERVLLMHRDAFANFDVATQQLRGRFAALGRGEPTIVATEPGELSLGDAVETYLFNSQLVTLPDGSMVLIAPIECRDHPRVQGFLRRILALPGNPIAKVHYLDVRQSMQNGGGPACLRLRVVMTEEEFGHIARGVIFNDELYRKLVGWVNRHYREALGPDDLIDPALMEESRAALDELSVLLGISLEDRRR